MDSLQAAVSLCSDRVFPVGQAAPRAVGMKRTQIRNCDSVFLFYWFMACG